MIAVPPLPTFRSNGDAMGASLEGELGRTQLAVESGGWGTVTLRVLGGAVHFQVDVPADNGQTFLVTGWFALGCRTGLTGVENIECLTGHAPSAVIASMISATKTDVIPDLVKLWHDLDPDDRLELLTQDAQMWAQRQAAEAFLGGPDPTDTGALADLREAHCRLAAYTTAGEVGVTARRLVEDGWGSSAEELMRTASAIVRPSGETLFAGRPVWA